MTHYLPRRASQVRALAVRGLDYQLRHWPADGPPTRVLVLLHGWADVSASFQFVVDHLPADWEVHAPDWRGFGGTEGGGADAFWFPDYLGDLDAMLDSLAPDRPVDLVGHSMGGNIAALYAGVRPTRVRRLVNLEGAGLPAADPHEAPARLGRWLDQLKTPMAASVSPDLDAVAARLMKNNPRLQPGLAAWLAPHWSTRQPDGSWRILADPAHKRVNPYLYRVDEVVACWAKISAPVLWVFCEHMKPWQSYVNSPEYADRLSVIPTLRRATVAAAGHMMHHDQPEAVASMIQDFL